MISHQQLKAASLLDPRLKSCGTALREVDDMTPSGEQDAELRFGPGQLRYYVMRVPKRSLTINAMTRHLQATQCLSSAEGVPFWMLLAEPSTTGPILDASKAWLPPSRGPMGPDPIVAEREPRFNRVRACSCAQRAY